MSMDPDAAETMYVHEEAMLSAVSPHPRIVSTYGLIVDPPFFCMVLEKADRGNLYDCLHATGCKAVMLAKMCRRRLAAQAAEALLHVHRCDIAHRDVKSLNYLAYSTGSVAIPVAMPVIKSTPDAGVVVPVATPNAAGEFEITCSTLESGQPTNTVPADDGQDHSEVCDPSEPVVLPCISVKLTDFGRARVMSSRRQSTAQGTLGWAAPESLLDNKIVKDVDITKYVSVIEKLRRSQAERQHDCCSWILKDRGVARRHLLANLSTWASPETANSSRRRESSHDPSPSDRDRGESNFSQKPDDDIDMSYDAYAADVYSFGVVLFEIATGLDPPDADVWTHQDYYDRAVSRPYLTAVDKYCEDKEVAEVIRR